MGIFGSKDKTSSRGTSTQKIDQTTVGTSDVDSSFNRNINRFGRSVFNINNSGFGASNGGDQGPQGGGLKISIGPNGEIFSDANLDSDLQRNTLARFQNVNRDAIDRFIDDAQDFRSDRSDFIKARVNPLQEALSERRGATARGLSRRNVFGSLTNNELQNFDSRADRELADARSLATNESIQAAIQAEGAAAGLNNKELELANFFMQRELRELGISLDTLSLSQQNQGFVAGESGTSNSRGRTNSRTTGTTTGTSTSTGTQKNGFGLGDAFIGAGSIASGFRGLFG